MAEALGGAGVALVSKLLQDTARAIAEELAPLVVKRSLKVRWSGTTCAVVRRLDQDFASDRSLRTRDINRVGCFATAQICRRMGFNAERMLGLSGVLIGELAAEQQGELEEVIARYGRMAAELAEEETQAHDALVDGFPQLHLARVGCNLIDRILENTDELIQFTKKSIRGVLRSSSPAGRKGALKNAQHAIVDWTVMMMLAEQLAETIRKRAVGQARKPAKACAFKAGS